MTDQEMRKLSRQDLLELLLALRQERDALQEELEQTKAALQDRMLKINEAGSIADATLRLSGVFEAAQFAAEQYLVNIRALSERQRDICAQEEAKARAMIEQQLKTAAQTAQKMEETSRQKCQAMEAEAKQRAEAYWQDAIARLQDFYKQYTGLKELFSTGEPK